MAKQVKLTYQGKQVYPQTITEAVADIKRKKKLSDILDDMDAVIASQEIEVETLTTGLEDSVLKAYKFTKGGEDLVTINIPKDLVVTAGEKIVVNDENEVEGLEDGTYLKLTIANQEEPVYINVEDLVDIITVEEDAEQVQLVLDENKELSATIVDGSVTNAKLEQVEVVTGHDDETDEDITEEMSIVEAVDYKVDQLAKKLQATTFEGSTHIELTETEAENDGTKTVISAITAAISADSKDEEGNAVGLATALDVYNFAVTVVEVADAPEWDDIFAADADDEEETPSQDGEDTQEP